MAGRESFTFRKLQSRLPVFLQPSFCTLWLRSCVHQGSMVALFMGSIGQVGGTYLFLVLSPNSDIPISDSGAHSLISPYLEENMLLSHLGSDELAWR